MTNQEQLSESAEQKINGCWVNLTNMDLERLEFWSNACQNAIIQAQEEKELVDTLIIQRKAEDRPQLQLIDENQPELGWSLA